MDDITKANLERRKGDAEADRRAIVDRVKAEGRTHLSDSENEVFVTLTDQIDGINSRFEDESRGDTLRAGADRIFSSAQTTTSGNKMLETNQAERHHSHVRDLISSVTPAVDPTGEGRRRLSGLESRNVTGLTSSTAFDPPQYLLDLYARVARPSAPLYSLLGKVQLDGPTVKTPKITSGNTAAVQSAENATINTTDWVDEYITVTPNTYAAASYISDQALSLSPVALDSLIFADLFAALAVELETAILYDAGFGLDTLAVSTGVTFATGSSDTADVLAAFAHALNAISTIRYNTSNVVAITHPSVILHQTSHCDTTGRPIYLGDNAFNPAGIPGAPSTLGQNVAPAVTIQGIPVYSDANITISGGTAPVYFIKLDDSFISEFGPKSLASPHTAALQIAWLLRCHSILGVTHRYPEALVKVTGFAAYSTGFGGS